jgi:glycosyltransferase involved in cell wall biosynthesis
MIVKDEEKVIKRCLKAALKICDVACIVDTGSTDKTKEIINKMVPEKNIWLFNYKWDNDFGKARSAVFDKIQGLNLGEYALVMDADDILHLGNGITKATLKKKLSEGKDVYDVLIKSGGITYYQRRLFSMKKRWQYHGALHEFPAADEGVESMEQISENLMWIEHKGDGASWANEQEKYKHHVSIFEKVKNEKALTAREQFYYAQSLLNAGMYVEAIDAYKQRIKMGPGDWTQEVFYAAYKIGWIYHKIGETDLARLSYLEAYNYDPERIEPLYQLCRMEFLTGRFALGYMYGRMAVETKLPAVGAKIFLEPYAWGPDLWNYYGLCAYRTGRKDEAKKAWEHAAKIVKKDQTALKESILRNLTFVNEAAKN